MQSNTKNQEKGAFQTSLVLLALSVGTLAFAWVLSLSGNLPPEPYPHGAAPMTYAPAKDLAKPFNRVALRLEKRLAARNMPVPGIAALERALAQRRALLDREVVFTVNDHSAPLRIVEHPEWIAFSVTPWSAEFSVSEDMVASALERGEAGSVPLLRTGRIEKTVRDAKNVLRAEGTDIATAGYQIDAREVAADIVAAFDDDGAAVTITAPFIDPVIVVADGGEERILSLLSTGLSDFNDSSADREHNVYKAFHERINNVILEPGQKFSLVDVLDAPITLQKGWKEEKGLFGGGVAMTPGAGICQAATTIYRAALLAGLPLVSKKAHSLFVDHYEFFGIGLDATVFPGVQDLVFRNDTDDIIVMQARTEGKTASIHFYGKSDGRSVALDGPYFVHTKNRPAVLRPVSLYQIGWVRTITYNDGTTKAEPLISTYAKPLWRSLMAKYDVPEGMTLLTQRESTAAMEKIAQAQAAAHAAAPVNADVVGL